MQAERSRWEEKRHCRNSLWHLTAAVEALKLHSRRPQTCDTDGTYVFVTRFNLAPLDRELVRVPVTITVWRQSEVARPAQ